MKKTCSVCGYTAQDFSENVCPYCGGKMETAKQGTDKPVSGGKFRVPIQQIWLPLCLIAALALLLVYVLLEPNKVRSQMTEVTNSVQQAMDEFQPTENQEETTETEQSEEETEQLTTDPSGNEILPDTQLPNISVQPEYVLAESARNEWTVITKSDNLNMRSGPGTEYDVVGKMPSGAQVTACGYSSNGPGNWIVVEYQGTYGWACTDYLQSNG